MIHLKSLGDKSRNPRISSERRTRFGPLHRRRQSFGHVGHRLSHEVQGHESDPGCGLCQREEVDYQAQFGIYGPIGEVGKGFVSSE